MIILLLCVTISLTVKEYKLIIHLYLSIHLSPFKCHFTVCMILQRPFSRAQIFKAYAT